MINNSRPGTTPHSKTDTSTTRDSGVGTTWLGLSSSFSMSMVSIVGSRTGGGASGGRELADGIDHGPVAQGARRAMTSRAD